MGEGPPDCDAAGGCDQDLELDWNFFAGDLEYDHQGARAGAGRAALAIIRRR